MIKSFFNSKKYMLWAWGGLALLFTITWGQVYLSVLLNEWYGRFYDILQKAEDINGFWQSMVEFSYLASAYIFISMFVLYFAQHYAFRWREAITRYYLPLWSNSSDDIEGASQRIQQDTYEFAKSLETLGLGLFKAILTLIAFIPILWGLSSYVNVEFLKDIEGSLFYIALLTSIGGMIVSYFVGIKLPGIEYDNQKVEARYRKKLVYAEDDIKHKNEESLLELFLGLRLNYFRLFNHYSYFNLWGNLYAQAMIILPYIIIAPSLFVGLATLGTIVQIGKAFGNVNDSFSYFIEHWTDITKFLSVIKRLREFEDILKANKH